MLSFVAKMAKTARDAGHSPQFRAYVLQARQQRHYGMDWLRVGAFLLLIFYHIGFQFTPWGAHTPTRGTVPWVEPALLALNAWRLALLFAISGYASAALMVKAGKTGDFLRSRFVRLGVPLLFGMTVIVAPQPYMGMAAQGYPHGFLYFLVHDFFGWRAVHGVFVPLWMHLWFVVYLLAYTVAICALAELPKSWREAARKGAERVLAGPMLLPLGVLFIWSVRQMPGDWTDTHELIDDGAAHLHYFAMFMFGVLLRNSEALRVAIARQWKLAAVIALLAYSWIAADAIAYPGNVQTPANLRSAFFIAKATQGWATIVALFGFADRYLNRDGKWRATLAEAVFPFYIIHQTIYVVVGYLIKDMGLTALPEFLILVASTVGGCWAFYLIGREIGPLRPLIGLSRQRAVRKPAGAAIAAPAT